LSEQDVVEQFSQSIVDALEDKKAFDLIVMDVRGHSPVTDRFIIASGRSDRQLKALAQAVMEAAHRRGMAVHVEGMEAMEWLLIDLGDVVVHLFLPEIRQTFQLEKLWSGQSRTDKEASASAS